LVRLVKSYSKRSKTSRVKTRVLISVSINYFYIFTFAYRLVAKISGQYAIWIVWYVIIFFLNGHYIHFKFRSSRKEPHSVVS
jgi:uncharacterized membrane protein YuzA (DUF378 family)